jgi:hypothetical protein
MRKLAVAAAFCLLSAGCASTQLNSNTLDLASSSESLITSQVLYNLKKFGSAPYAIPAQVSIPSGSATTTNAVTPTLGGAIGPSLTTTLANSAAAPGFFATTKTHLNPNSTLSVSVGDQWSQNWTLTPLSDPDQLRRLRALYRFGAGWTNRPKLACEYPVVQKTGGGNGTSSSQTVNVYVNGAKADKDANNGGGNDLTAYTVDECEIERVVKLKTTIAGKPVVKEITVTSNKTIREVDPAFVTLPSCILCDYQSDHHLVVNKSLTNGWLWKPEQPTPFGDPVRIGHIGDPELYLAPNEFCDVQCSEKEFSDFVLFVLEATLQSAAGSGGGKGSPQKGGAPGILQEKAQPQLQLLQ